jgi:hypothetical protein
VARLARVIGVGVAHHVTQSGNGRRFLLESDADRHVYLDLLRENLALHGVLLVSYWLMVQSLETPLKPGSWRVTWLKPESMHSIENVEIPESAATLPRKPPTVRVELKFAA